ncbi:translation initiation factor IF-2-like [Leopardus geoffroyi]|uniref:translation initiation factor IF-2-like n=1 Tax=Leopardus geoffroyi TaxID=46844 RepID=UPI001E260987|nr:translation initiation factor IF-2-like [Leopardus geoffroyi]
MARGAEAARPLSPQGPSGPRPCSRGSPGRPRAREGPCAPAAAGQWRTCAATWEESAGRGQGGSRELAARRTEEGGPGRGRGRRAPGLGPLRGQGAGRARGSRELPGGWEGPERVRAPGPVRPLRDGGARGARGGGALDWSQGGEGRRAHGAGVAGQGCECALGAPPGYPEGGRGARAGARTEPVPPAVAGARPDSPPSKVARRVGGGGARTPDLALLRGAEGRPGTARRTPVLPPARAQGGPWRLRARQPSAREAERRQLRHWTLVLACLFKAALSRIEGDEPSRCAGARTPCAATEPVCANGTREAQEPA